MVPIINSRAYSVGPILQSHVDCDTSNFTVAGASKYRKFSNCANEAQQCQARINCLENALGLMQNELDRLQKEQQYSGSSDADSWSSVNVGFSPVNANNNTKKRGIQYDKISVWPSTMFDDWVQRLKDQPPKPLPRTASLHDKLFRARSMAPNHQSELHRSNTTATGGWNIDRATSAPPAPPPPIFRR